MSGLGHSTYVTIYDVNIDKVYYLRFNGKVVTGGDWPGMSTLNIHYESDDCTGPELFGINNPHDVVALGQSESEFFTTKLGAEKFNAEIGSSLETSGFCTYYNIKKMNLPNAVEIEPIVLPEYTGPLIIVEE